MSPTATRIAVAGILLLAVAQQGIDSGNRQVGHIDAAGRQNHRPVIEDRHRAAVAHNLGQNRQDASGEDTAFQIAAALEGRTPYDVADLVFDWRGAGTEVKTATRVW